jgi:hypothetical protein
VSDINARKRLFDYRSGICVAQYSMRFFALLCAVTLVCAIEKTVVFVLCYDSHSCLSAERSFAYPWAVVHQIPAEHNTRYMENYFYYTFYPSQHAVYQNYSYVGVIGYKAREKVKLDDDLPVRLRPHDCDAHYFRAHKWEINALPILQNAEKWHGKPFIRAWNLIFQNLSRVHESVYRSEELPLAYFNYWLARPHVMLAYCYFASALREVMESASGELRQLLESDSGYTGERPSSIFPLWYTYHPFLCERFLSVFLEEHKHVVRLCEI